jgi:uncharacterized membrane protein (DUF4010 family)
VIASDGSALVVAVGIGLLLGLERERRKGTGPTREPAGVRTFALVSLLGAALRIAGGDVLVATGAAFVGALAIVGWLRKTHEDPGITTEVALVVAYALGVLAVHDATLAAATGVVVTILLALRDWLHHLVRESLTEREVHDGLVFLAAAIVALPLAPDRAMGPGGVINPFAIWRLVVVMMAISGAGYVVVRVVGPRLGLPLSGFIAGFISASATVAAMGVRAREQPGAVRAATAGAALATVPTVIVAAVLVATADRPTFDRVIVPLAAAGAVAAAWATLVSLRAAHEQPPPGATGRAFDLRAALVLAGIITTTLAVSTIANERFPDGGVLVSSAIAGLADAHSAAFAAAVLAAEGKVSANDAAVAILAALTTNSITKVALAFGSRQRRFAIGVSAGLVLMVAATWAAWAIVAAVG